MNTLEGKIIDIVSKPIYKEVGNHSWWEVEIKYNIYGRITKDKELFKNRKDAMELSVGDKIWR